MHSFAVQLLALIMLSMMNYCQFGYEHKTLYFTKSSTKPRNSSFFFVIRPGTIVYPVDTSQDGSHVKYVSGYNIRTKRQIACQEL